jgi:HPt (histidine-containing phosphotransfer) domain-containing protein
MFGYTADAIIRHGLLRPAIDIQKPFPPRSSQEGLARRSTMWSATPMTRRSEMSNASGGRSTPFVDIERFRNDLREGGVEEMLGVLLDTFAEDCPARLAALESAIESHDPAAIASAAHAFKSGAATIRAEGLAEALSRVEEAGRSGNLKSIPALLDQIRAERVGVLRELAGMKRK